MVVSKSSRIESSNNTAAVGGLRFIFLWFRLICLLAGSLVGLLVETLILLIKYIPLPNASVRDSQLQSYDRNFSLTAACVELASGFCCFIFIWW